MEGGAGPRQFALVVLVHHVDDTRQGEDVCETAEGSSIPDDATNVRIKAGEQQAQANQYNVKNNHMFQSGVRLAEKVQHELYPHNVRYKWIHGQYLKEQAQSSAESHTVPGKNVVQQHLTNAWLLQGESCIKHYAHSHVGQRNQDVCNTKVTTIIFRMFLIS